MRPFNDHRIAMAFSIAGLKVDGISIENEGCVKKSFPGFWEKYDSLGGIIMAGSTFGKIFQVSTWGESHGKGLGVVVQGCPPGVDFDEKILQAALEQTKAGAGCHRHQEKGAR